jgi:hypothetical protein
MRQVFARNFSVLASKMTENDGGKRFEQGGRFLHFLIPLFFISNIKKSYCKNRGLHKKKLFRVSKHIGF